MTHYKQLQAIKKKLLSEEDSQKRKIKEKTLFYLMNPRNYERGNLNSVISIPKHDVDADYLGEVLKQLGYPNPKYEEDYDGYYECTCYKITL